METSSKISLIQLDNQMKKTNEKSTIRPASYEELKKFIIDNFGINSFIVQYFDKNNQKINITDNEIFKKSNDVIFIVENNTLKQSVYDIIYPNLNETQMDVIDEKYLCNICSEKLSENPFYCYQCSKRFCKKCLTDLSIKMKPLQCPFCKFELEFSKWCTLTNFEEEKNQYLGLIEENIELKNLNQDKIVNEFPKQIKMLNTKLREAYEIIKNQKMIIIQRNEEIRRSKEEINKFEKILKNQISEKKAQLEKKEAEINLLKKEKNYLSNQLKMSYENSMKMLNNNNNNLMPNNQQNQRPWTPQNPQQNQWGQQQWTPSNPWAQQQNQQTQWGRQSLPNQQQGGFSNPFRIQRSKTMLNLEPDSAHEHPIYYNKSLLSTGCRICKQTLYGDPGYKCGCCSLILCFNCSQKIFYGNKLRHVHQHQLDLVCKNAFKCELCKQIYNNSASFYCRKCDYNVCASCYIRC